MRVRIPHPPPNIKDNIITLHSFSNDHPETRCLCGLMQVKEIKFPLILNYEGCEYDYPERIQLGRWKIKRDDIRTQST